MTTYSFRTDAAHGEIEANDMNAAVARLIADREWAELDSARETADIANGAWLAIDEIDGTETLRRGKMP